jgi:hypothetical protein
MLTYLNNGDYFTEQNTLLSTLRPSVVDKYVSRTNQDIPKGMVRTLTNHRDQGYYWKAKIVSEIAPPLHNPPRYLIPTERNCKWYEVAFKNWPSTKEEDPFYYPAIDIAQNVLDEFHASNRHSGESVVVETLYSLLHSLYVLKAKLELHPTLVV